MFGGNIAALSKNVRICTILFAHFPIELLQRFNHGFLFGFQYTGSSVKETCLSDQLMAALPIT